MTNLLKIRENRIQRGANGRGLAVVKLPRTVRPDSEQGGYLIIDPQTKAAVLRGDSGDGGLTIQQVEEYFADPRRVGSFAIANVNAANDE